MKKLLGLCGLFCLCMINSFATDYYFATAGNDANAGTIGAPWKTIVKFNSVFSSRAPGDRMLFKRGDIFTGTMNINRAGTVALPITVGAYGTGADPIITGLSDVVTWTNLGSNIWESTFAVSTLATLNMVVINGVNTAMGRTPNYPTYYQWQSHGGSGSTSTLTSSNLNASVTNWAVPAGAEVAFFGTTYIVNRFAITAASGTQITYNATVPVLFGTPSSYFVPYMFIQNDPRTLDVQNEWYYNPTTKRIRIYSTSMPSNVQVASTTNLVTWTSFSDNIIVEQIQFTGSNSNAMTIQGVKNTKIINNRFAYIGGNAIFGAPFGGARLFTNNIIDTNIFYQVQNMAVDVNEVYNIRRNGVIGVGMLIGMNSPPGVTTTPNSTGIAFRTRDDSAEISYNVFDSIGLSAIYWYGNHTKIHHNYLNRVGTGLGYKDDGAIYIWNGPFGGALITLVGNKIYKNIITNSGAATPAIYFDTEGNGAEVYDNSVYKAARGVYLGQGSRSINVHDNTVYDVSDQEGCITVDTHDANTSGFTFKNNILVAKTLTTFSLWTITDAGNRAMPTPFTSDSNYYVKPISVNTAIQSYLYGAVPTNQTLTLAAYRTLNGQDANSQSAPLALADTSKIKFVFNPNSYDSTVILGATYIDSRNVTYNNTILLPEFSSAVLFYSSASINIPPIADAGADQIITASSTTLNGTNSTDADGTIVGYSWTQLSGPGATITSPSSATTNVTGMSPGSYLFQLEVTDNDGSTDTDNMTVLVNSIPTADADVDQTITLPTNSVTMSGGATDSDGTIASTLWSQVSGPAAATITTPSNLNTTITGLVQGAYVFQLLVTDNFGATDTDDMSVTVDPVPSNIAPVADAGIDQTITLPTNSVTLSASGSSDVDGTIVSYLWNQVSGPNTATLTSASSVSTNANGLVAGTYNFRVRVIDNDGGVDFDTVQVLVNPANINPTVNAGSDQVITGTSTTLTSNGGIDTDGTIVSYLWTQLSGPSTATIVSSASSSTLVSNLDPGIYTFRITVTDDDGGTGFDNIAVTVGVSNMKLIITRGKIIFLK